MRKPCVLHFKNLKVILFINFKRLKQMNKPTPNNLAEKVKNKTIRREDSQKNASQVLLGFKMFGIVGWSVVIPTLAGTALGMWLDEKYPGPRSYTLMLLVAGLFLGSAGAWFWVEKQHREIHQKKKEGEDK